MRDRRTVMSFSPVSDTVTDPGSPARATGSLALFCRVRDRVCALPLAHVVETMRPLAIEQLTAMPAFVRGLARIRGAAVPVVDAGALLGARDEARFTRFVTVRTGERCVALAVEEVLGVGELAEASLQELPPLLREAGDAVIAAVGSLDAELLLVLRAARIAPQSLWDALEARG
jgi:purine-binding chemotaxis protein CheW